MFNRFRNLFRNERDRETDIEAQLLPEEYEPRVPRRFPGLPVRITSRFPTERHALTEQRYSGSQFETPESPLLGAVGGEIREQSDNEGYDNPVLEEPEPTQPVETVINLEKNYKDMGFRYTQNLREDLIELAKIGIVINLNAILGSGTSGAQVYRGHYLGIPELQHKTFAVKVFIYDDPNQARHKAEAEKAIMNSIPFHKYLVNIQNVINMGQFRSLSYQRIVRGQQGFMPEDIPYTSSDRIYIFMDFSDLGPLDRFLAKRQPLNTNELRAITFQLLEGLRHIHNQGICHGDIHGGNVFMFSESDHIDIESLGIGRSSIGTISVNFIAKLADFGEANRSGNFKYDMTLMAEWIFDDELFKHSDFDNPSDKTAFENLVKKMQFSPDVNTLYQSVEFRNWFQIY